VKDYDGYVVIHSNGTDEAGASREDHAIGPVPSRSLAEMLVLAMFCPCTKTIMGVSFPPGTRMLLEGSIASFDDMLSNDGNKPELMN